MQKVRYVHQHRMVLYVINPIIHYGVNDLLTPTPSPKARHGVEGCTNSNISNILKNKQVFKLFLKILAGTPRNRQLSRYLYDFKLFSFDTPKMC